MCALTRGTGRSDGQLSCQRKKTSRGPRIPFTGLQVHKLEQKFSERQYLSSDEVAQLATLLNLSETRVSRRDSCPARVSANHSDCCAMLISRLLHKDDRSDDGAASSDRGTERNVSREGSEERYNARREQGTRSGDGLTGAVQRNERSRKT